MERNNKPDISVIMPVYNTGIILRDTIDSILQQTFKNFELIIVDDGSIDVSKSICDDYAEKDLRVRVYHKKNGGISDARNFGITKSQGRYITFCDHDDIYMPDKLKVQYEAAETTGADVVAVGHVVSFDYKQKKEYYGSDVTCMTRLDVASNIFDIIDNFSLTIWDKLYRREHLINYMIFDTKYTKGQEDVCFNLNIYSKINSFIGIKIPLYRHIIRKGLSTSSQIHKETIMGMLDSISYFNNCVKQLNVNLIQHENEYINHFSKLVKCLFICAGSSSFSKNDFDYLKQNIFCLVSTNKYGEIRDNINKFIFFLFKNNNSIFLFIVCRCIAICKRSVNAVLPA